jgi:hypothetical protein
MQFKYDISSETGIRSIGDLSIDFFKIFGYIA